MNTAMAQSCILLPDKPGQEQLWVIATEKAAHWSYKKSRMNGQPPRRNQTGIDVALQRAGGDECYTLNIVSHATLFVKGSFTVTYLNQHLFFIKVNGSHSRGTVRCADSHLEIDLSKL